jgi:hypothetical protein
MVGRSSFDFSPAVKLGVPTDVTVSSSSLFRVVLNVFVVVAQILRMKVNGLRAKDQPLKMRRREKPTWSLATQRLILLSRPPNKNPHGPDSNKRPCDIQMFACMPTKCGIVRLGAAAVFGFMPVTSS